VDLIPAQPQLIPDGLLAGGFQPVNGQGFKQSRKPAGGFGPRQLHHPHAMGGALAARRVGMRDGAVLTSIQAPPLPFGLVVVQWAGCRALGTGPTGEVRMGQIDVYFLGCQLQVQEATRRGFSMPRMRR
jgi:hypothetical protein